MRAPLGGERSGARQCAAQSVAREDVVEATRTLNLKAFAFEAGDALVEYSWGRTQTPCCMATAACGGSLTLAVEEGASADVGEIPVGKKDLRVTLVESAGEDIDVHTAFENNKTSATTTATATI